MAGFVFALLLNANYHVAATIGLREDAPGVVTGLGKSSSWNRRTGEYEGIGVSIGSLINLAHFVLDDEVVDETGLAQRYDLKLEWEPSEPASILDAIRDQIGLELAPGQRKLTDLVVDSVEETRTR